MKKLRDQMHLGKHWAKLSGRALSSAALVRASSVLVDFVQSVEKAGGYRLDHRSLPLHAGGTVQHTLRNKHWSLVAVLSPGMRA